jgi:hypothetical protein
MCKSTNYYYAFMIIWTLLHKKFTEYNLKDITDFISAYLILCPNILNHRRIFVIEDHIIDELSCLIRLVEQSKTDSLQEDMISRYFIANFLLSVYDNNMQFKEWIIFHGSYQNEDGKIYKCMDIFYEFSSDHSINIGNINHFIYNSEQHLPSKTSFPALSYMIDNT